MNVGQRGVQLRPDGKETHDRETFHARKDPCRRHGRLGQDHRNAVADLSAEVAGQNIPQHDAELARLQVIQRTGHHVLPDNGHLVFPGRIHPVDQQTMHLPPGRRHALRLRIRRCGHHGRMFECTCRHLLPVHEWRPPLLDHGVGYGAQNALSQLPVKPVHDRQHRNQNQHAQNQSNHGGEGNERYEMIIAL